MSVSIYDFSIPVFTRMLTNLSGLIDKATAYAETRKFDSKVLLEVRLFPDMLPFAKQVQIACDNAKGAAARLAGIEAPKHEDNEGTMAELKARIAKTLAFLQTIKPEQLQGAETRQITVPMRTGPLHFAGLAYLTGFALPNVYFHVTTAYALLRHNGVEVGKGDFLGSLK
ncbi:MAG: DUF1993 family protein [Steroidobacterales bacterium]